MPTSQPSVFTKKPVIFFLFFRCRTLGKARRSDFSKQYLQTTLRTRLVFTKATNRPWTGALCLGGPTSPLRPSWVYGFTSKVPVINLFTTRSSKVSTKHICLWRGSGSRSASFWNSDPELRQNEMPIRIRIKVKSRIRMHIKSKCPNSGATEAHNGAVEAHNGAVEEDLYVSSCRFASLSWRVGLGFWSTSKWEVGSRFASK